MPAERFGPGEELTEMTWRQSMDQAPSPGPQPPSGHAFPARPAPAPPMQDPVFPPGVGSSGGVGVVGPPAFVDPGAWQVGSEGVGAPEWSPSVQEQLQDLLEQLDSAAWEVQTPQLSAGQLQTQQPGAGQLGSGLLGAGQLWGVVDPRRSGSAGQLQEPSATGGSGHGQQFGWGDRSPGTTSWWRQSLDRSHSPRSMSRSRSTSAGAEGSGGRAVSDHPGEATWQAGTSAEEHRRR